MEVTKSPKSRAMPMLKNKDLIHDEWVAVSNKFDESLPIWAGVLFALRCAHRVYPLIDHFCPSRGTKAKLAIQHGIETGYDYGLDLLDDRSTYRACYQAARKAKEEITHSVSSVDVPNSVAAAYAAEAAEVALAATVYATLDLNAFYKSAKATRSLAALAAQIAFGDAASALVTKSAAIDFRLLEQQADGQIDRNKRPNWLGFLGPIWPVGKPVGWIDVERGACLSSPNGLGEQNLIRAFGPLAVQTKADPHLVDLLDEVLESLSALNAAFGGTGIQFTSQSTKVSFYEDSKSNRRTTERQGWFVESGNTEYRDLSRATLDTLDMIEDVVAAGLRLPPDWSPEGPLKLTRTEPNETEKFRQRLDQLRKEGSPSSSWQVHPSHHRGSTNRRERGQGITLLEVPNRPGTKLRGSFSGDQEAAILGVLQKTKEFREAGGELEIVASSVEAIRTQLADLL